MYTCITCRCVLLLLVLRTTMHMHACRLVGSCWHCQLNSCERSTRSVAATLASSGHPSRSIISSIHRPADRPESQAAQHYLAGACCPLVGPGHYSSQPRKRHAARPLPVLRSGARLACSRLDLTLSTTGHGSPMAAWRRRLLAPAPIPRPNEAL